MTRRSFDVDTKLFAELGELLVGRDSTALSELIKNAYDADATLISVHAENLDDPDEGLIRVTDDGIGMTASDFDGGFLTIASRSRSDSDRRSTLFERRFTGAKGLGRLAAHKLARRIEIDSTPHTVKKPGGRSKLRAVIDWDIVERVQTLGDLEQVDAVLVETPRARKGAEAGTIITLTRLRRAWTEAERAAFIAEVGAYSPPSVLVEPIPPGVLPTPPLVESPRVRDVLAADDPGATVRLSGDFAGGDSFWDVLLETYTWILEIDADAARGRVRYRVSPTARKLAESGGISPLDAEVDHPHSGASFHARILMREGRIPRVTGFRDWIRRSSGVRVYMEGFRVLPYGSVGDDWLSIDSDYTRRAGSLDVPGVDLEVVKRESLYRLPNQNYVGGVFLTEARASDLKMLVNREGFVPSPTLTTVNETLRRGLNLATRYRAAIGARADATDDRVEGATESRTVGEALASARTPLRGLKRALGRGDLSLASKHLASLEESVSSAERLWNSDESVRSYELVLSAVGTQMAAFSHEINALVGTAQALDEGLRRIVNEFSLDASSSASILRLHEAASEIRRNLEREASYLVDVVSLDARRRRRRIPVDDAVDSAWALLERRAAAASVRLVRDIGPDTKTPPMYRGEIVSVLLNLLTNAIKGAGDEGRISVSSRVRPSGALRIRIQNTGIAVDLADAEKWFSPFESTTVDVDPILGQGMGLGLPIVRRILDRYNASVKFTDPGSRYATSVLIEFPA